MGQVVGVLEIQMQADIARLKKDMAQVKGLTARTMKGVESSVNFAKKALAGLGLGLGMNQLVQSMRSAIATQADFEQSISDLSAITGATGKSLAYLSGQAREMGASTTFSASEAATAFKLVASAKPDLLDNASALSEVTKQALMLAEASGSTLPDAANTLGSSLNQFQKGSEDANRFINVLAAGSKFGASEILDTSMALKTVGTVASNVGLSFEETNAALQVMSTMALKSSEAGTGLRGTLLKLEAQSNNQFKPSVVGLSQAFINLRNANLTTTQQVKLFGVMNVTAAKSLITNADKIGIMTDKLTGTSVALEQARIKTDNLRGDMKRLNSAFEEQQIVMGEKLNPSLRVLVQGLASVMTIEKQSGNALKNTTDQAREMAIVIAKVADIIGNAANGIGFAFGSIGKVIGAGVAQLQLVLHGEFKQAGEIGRQLAEDLKNDLDKISSPEITDRFERLANEIIKTMEVADDAVAAQTVKQIAREIKISGTIITEEEKKIRKSLSTGITGGIMEGFENGKSFSKVFEDMTKRMFKDMVLEPQIKAAVTAGVDWVRELLISSTTTSTNTTSIVALTAAVNANTAAQASAAGGNVAGGAAAGSASGLGTVVTAGTYMAIAYMAYSFFEDWSDRASGITGSVGPGGVNAQGWSSTYNAPSFVGALFGQSDEYKKIFYDLTEEQLKGFNDSFTNTKNIIVRFADQLKISTEALDTYTTSFDISGTSESINQLFRRISDEMTYAVLGVNMSEIEAANAAAIAAAQAALDAINYKIKTSLEGNIYALGGLAEQRTKAESELKNAKAAMQAAIVEATPDWFNELQKAGESAIGTLDRVGAEIRTVDGIWKTLGYDTAVSFGALGEGLLSVSVESIKAREALIAQAGGLDELTAREMEFYNIAYTKQERDANTFTAAKEQIAELFASLGMDVPDSMVAFRELRGSLDLTTESGREAFAAITDAAGAFSIISNAADDAGSKLSKTAEEISALFNPKMFSSMIEYNRAVGLATSPSLKSSIGFANGGVFTNGLYSSPTPFMFANGAGFSNGVMAENGIEAVMPLGRSRTGQLGVHVLSNPNDNNIVSELRALRSEVSSLRVLQSSAAYSSDKTAKKLSKFDRQGLPAERVLS